MIVPTSKEGLEDASVIIDLPHDAMIHESRCSASPGGVALAFFPGGVYVYEKSFDVPEDWEDKHIVFGFEGSI